MSAGRWLLGVVGLVLAVSCTLLGGPPGTTTTTVASDLPPLPAQWEKVLDLSTLPALQDNLSGDPGSAWIYANAVLGAEVWILDDGGRAGPNPDVFATEPSRLAVPLTESGWPRQLPADERVSLAPTLVHKAPTPAGQLRSSSDQALTGLYVVTWKGQTLPDSLGQSQFSVHDDINDAWSAENQGTKTIVVPAGDHRVLVLIRSVDRGLRVEYRQPDPADPIRDVKIWCPNAVGAGLELAAHLGSWSASGFGAAPGLDAAYPAGALKAWCTEPGPGEAEPRWHPAYLAHLAQDPSAVARFMGWLKINGLESAASVSWADRTPEAYTLTNLVGVSLANYERHPLSTFRSGTGVPYEWIFDLCNVAAKDCWLQVPHTATDDLVRSLAALAAERLAPGRKLWFEFSNELWNTYAPYLPQYRAAEAAGQTKGQSQAWGSGWLQGRALRTFERAWAAAGGTDDRLVNVVSGFALSSGYNAEVLAGAAAAGSPLAEVLAVTTYFGADLTEALFRLDFGAGNPGDEVYQAAKSLLRGSIYRDYEAWKANANLARDNHVGLVAYEGGSHVLATGHGRSPDDPAVDQKNQAFLAFLANLHQHQVMKDLYLEHWALWCAAGARTASLFTDIGGYGYYGYWGAKEDVTQTPDESPRWSAAQDFVALQSGLRALGDPIGTAPRLALGRSWRGEAGLPFEATLSFSGGEGPLSVAVVGGALPAGVTATPEAGALRLAGTPLGFETARFVVRVVDGDGDPDYGVCTVVVDPAGTTAGAFVLFDPAALPAAPLAQSENRPDFQTRFDPARQAVADTDPAGNPRLAVPFDPAAALFDRHYLDPSVTVAATSAFAPSGGWTLTVRKDAFVAAHPGAWDQERALANRVLWFGLRDGALTGWLGDSVDSAGQTFGVPTRFDALLLWRRDQLGFAGQALAFGSGSGQASLLLESGGTGAGAFDLRFVVRVRQNGAPVYYLSEASWTETAEGRFALTDFQAQSAPGKRWAVFDPGSGPLMLPDPAVLAFASADLTDVEAVGFALRAQADGWHYGLALRRFLAVGATR